MKYRNSTGDENATHCMGRRGFFAKTGATLTSLSLMKPSIIFGSTANSKIKLGHIGCGGRGTWIAKLFQSHGGYEYAAVADYFQDRVDTFGDLFDIPQDKRFTGLSGYQRMIEQGVVDAIVIETPPYFHPQQAAAGVAAGLHVYVAKPIAVDVPGCLTIEESGKKARSQKLCFLIDFQTRANPIYQEALKRVHEGAIGTLAFGEAFYHAGNPWEDQIAYLKDDPKNPENRLRAWGLDRILSGDIITEQNIHTLDVANWILEKPPLRASGHFGHKVRVEGGNCHDSFQIVYEYPDHVGISFTSRQFEGYGTLSGIRNRMYGADGVLETEYGGDVIIRGKNPYEGGNTANIYTSGAETNIATFHDSIQTGRYENPTVECSVQSNLITILGRTAAYSQEIVRWDDLLKKNEKYEFDLDGLAD